VRYIVSDDHAGLRAALAARLSGVPWQRCQFHLQQNVIQHVSQLAMRKEVAEGVRDVFNAPDRHEADRRLARLVEKYRPEHVELADWLEENVPEIPLVDVGSTALAAQMAAEDETAAAIASEMAAGLYGLQVVREKIEDNPSNFTRFLVIGRRLPARSGRDKTSVMFSVRDEPGILYRMLEPFSKRGVNLSKIESRPMKTKAWEYIFFLDMEGHIEEENVREAIEDLKQYCQFLKVLGSYPKAKY